MPLLSLVLMVFITLLFTIAYLHISHNQWIKHYKYFNVQFLWYDFVWSSWFLAEDNNMQMQIELQKAGKQYELLVYPQKAHGVTGPLSRHMQTAMTDFFERMLR